MRPQPLRAGVEAAGVFVVPGREAREPVERRGRPTIQRRPRKILMMPIIVLASSHRREEQRPFCALWSPGGELKASTPSPPPSQGRQLAAQSSAIRSTSIARSPSCPTEHFTKGLSVQVKKESDRKRERKRAREVLIGGGKGCPFVLRCPAPTGPPIGSPEDISPFKRGPPIIGPSVLPPISDPQGDGRPHKTRDPQSLFMGTGGRAYTEQLERETEKAGRLSPVEGGRALFTRHDISATFDKHPLDGRTRAPGERGPTHPLLDSWNFNEAGRGKPRG
ncbi:hypothetical protein AAG570_011353 [Ranatra chinensis]|uniref:Uncharacterized protein n=1 Tax=Ranatra chinensis TaxID=642074 RepID=A0ABD0YKL6_9HEMI